MAWSGATTSKNESMNFQMNIIWMIFPDSSLPNIGLDREFVLELNEVKKQL